MLRIVHSLRSHSPLQLSVRTYATGRGFFQKIVRKKGDARSRDSAKGMKRRNVEEKHGGSLAKHKSKNQGKYGNSEAKYRKEASKSTDKEKSKGADKEKSKGADKEKSKEKSKDDKDSRYKADGTKKRTGQPPVAKEYHGVSRLQKELEAKRWIEKQKRETTKMKQKQNEARESFSATKALTQEERIKLIEPLPEKRRKHAKIHPTPLAEFDASKPVMMLGDDGLTDMKNLSDISDDDEFEFEFEQREKQQQLEEHGDFKMKSAFSEQQKQLKEYENTNEIEDDVEEHDDIPPDVQQKLAPYLDSDGNIRVENDTELNYVLRLLNVQDDIGQIEEDMIARGLKPPKYSRKGTQPPLTLDQVHQHLVENNAEDVVVLDIREKCDWAEYMIVVTCQSPNQQYGLGVSIQRRVRTCARSFRSFRSFHFVQFISFISFRSFRSVHFVLSLISFISR
jgi:hypothetical protein